ncbi:MAG: T9SS type A sorting domain-containing protein, partial [Bacteroidia bacterium]
SQRAWYDVQLQVVFADTTIELKKNNFIYITAVGLKDVRNEKEMFEVWPNPSSGIINIKNRINSSPFEIELLSMEGKLLLKTNSNELNKNELELPQQNGFFILRMKCENETYFYKIQKVN